MKLSSKTSRSLSSALNMVDYPIFQVVRSKNDTSQMGLHFSGDPKMDCGVHAGFPVNQPRRAMLTPASNRGLVSGFTFGGAPAPVEKSGGLLIRGPHYPQRKTSHEEHCSNASCQLAKRRLQERFGRVLETGNPLPPPSKKKKKKKKGGGCPTCWSPFKKPTFLGPSSKKTRPPQPQRRSQAPWCPGSPAPEGPRPRRTSCRRCLGIGARRLAHMPEVGVKYVSMDPHCFSIVIIIIVIIIMLFMLFNSFMCASTYCMHKLCTCKCL